MSGASQCATAAPARTVSEDRARWLYHRLHRYLTVDRFGALQWRPRAPRRPTLDEFCRGYQLRIGRCTPMHIEAHR